MIDRTFIVRVTTHTLRLAPLCASISLFCAATLCMATTPADTQLPDTPVGHLAGELIRHANDDSPVRITLWTPRVLSASMASDDKAAFVTDLASAARDGGGLDVFDVRTDPHQPGMLEVAVKARRNAQAAL